MMSTRLWLSRAVSSMAKPSFESELMAKIKFNGPLSLAQFMQEVLTNPVKGYYTTKERVLGGPGDFVTSPEISQMFGECIGIWIIHEWRKMGSAKPLHLVELGPGHGTLMNDILRTILKLTPQELPHISLHLVETSPNLTRLQEAKLCGSFHSKPATKAITKQGPPAHWHSRVSEIPKGFTFFIANEFFDALPIHKFVRDPKTHEWHEILVDAGLEKLQWTKARQKTLANQYVENDSFYDHLEAAEISPKAGTVLETMSERIVEHGGAALIADYGYDKDDNDDKRRDTFRAFKDHKQCDPLEQVGLADLTADVDFDYLRRKSGPHTLTYGPVSQRQFLTQLGIQVRYNLLKDSNPDLSEEFDRSLSMLIDPDQMGTRFKFFCLFPKTMETIHSEHLPVGFME